MTSQELEKIKLTARSCLESGSFLKITIIPINDGPFKDEYHVITNDSNRNCFTTHEAACMWASTYFMVASALPTAKELLEERNNT